MVKISMDKVNDKFGIEIAGKGVVITSEDGVSLQFTALEALMLLDILQNEKPRLRGMADEASPCPIKINL